MDHIPSNPLDGMQERAGHDIENTGSRTHSSIGDLAATVGRGSYGTPNTGSKKLMEFYQAKGSSLLFIHLPGASRDAEFDVLGRVDS
jgi:hypothetical protein